MIIRHVKPKRLVRVLHVHNAGKDDEPSLTIIAQEDACRDYAIGCVTSQMVAMSARKCVLFEPFIALELPACVAPSITASL